MNSSALIPAYNPSEDFVDYVTRLASSTFEQIVIVNDGSSQACDEIFKRISRLSNVEVLKHAINLGKGAALKTGLNHIYCCYPQLTGVVTIDADGQHLIKDALNVGQKLLEYPERLVLGARLFNEAPVPLRSKIGNELTKGVFRLLVGEKITDTQTGLRGIPKSFIPQLLKINSNGYEFELDMLLACKYSDRKVCEVGISTVYLEGNLSSHFNPILDSMRIYFVLLRFSLASLVTAGIDYLVFFLIYFSSSNILLGQFSARTVALSFNYLLVRKIVFYSGQKHFDTFPKYLLLVVLSGTLSYWAISTLVTVYGVSVLYAKILTELLFFLANFTIQRDLIFTRKSSEVKTNWDKYYSRPYKAASVTRKITESVLHGFIRKYCLSKNGNLDIGEFGGANSCFYDGVKEKIRPNSYHVFDNNKLGLAKFQERIDNDKTTFLYEIDVLAEEILGNLNLDLIFSVGLIEHFDIQGTQKVVRAHLKALKPGGIVIISFPTPTWLYKITRRLSMMLGLWIFHDERPIYKNEVIDIVQDHGDILDGKIIWPIFLTQAMLVIRKT